MLRVCPGIPESITLCVANGVGGPRRQCEPKDVRNEQENCVCARGRGDQDQCEYEYSPRWRYQGIDREIMMQIWQEYGRKVSGNPQHRSGYQDDGKISVEP